MTTEFFQCAQQGNTGRLKELIQSGAASVSSRDPDSVTALHWAAINNHLETVQFLVSSGAEVEAIGGELQSTPLHWAVRQGHISVVHFLVKMGADPRRPDGQGYTCLHLAAQFGHVYVCLYLLLSGISVNELDREKRTPLMWAVYKGLSPEIVPLLIKFGAELDLVDVLRCSALHWGALKGNRVACKQLIKAGASAEGKDEKGLTPLGCATEKGNGGWFKKLLDDHQIDRSRFNTQTRKKVLHLLPFVAIPLVFSTVTLLPWYLGLCMAILEGWGAARVAGEVAGPMSLVQTPLQLGFFQASFLLVLVTYLSTVMLATVDYLLTNCFVIVCCIAVIYFLKKTTYCDPGFISPPSNLESIKPLVLELLEQHRLDRRNLCPTCFVRKPLRSKHDRETDHCVALFDHYCPWIYNAVGVNNHRDFLIFLGAACLSQLFYAFLAIEYFRRTTNTSLPMDALCLLPWSWCAYASQHTWVFFSVFWCIFNCFWQSLTFYTQVYQISKGLTTNEMLNKYRYEYLFEDQGEQKVYRNPFHRGFLRNWIGFLSGPSLNPETDWFQTFDVRPRESCP